MSENCEYRIEHSLTKLSECRDYLNVFECCVPGMKEENTAVNQYFTSNYLSYIHCSLLFVAHIYYAKFA